MISNQEIRSQVVHDITYTKGVQYYSKGKVARLDFDAENRIFSADVMGQQRYHVRIFFNESQHIQSATCQCQAYANYKGACKHIVAVLKSIQMNWEKHWAMSYKDTVPNLESVAKGLHLQGSEGYYGNQKGSSQLSRSEAEAQQEAKLRQRMEDLASKRFYEAFQLLEQEERIGTASVALIPILVISENGMLGATKYLELSIRSNRIYPIKQIHDFLMQYSQNQSIAFGKSFIFEPSNSSLDLLSQGLLELLMTSYWNEKQIEQGSAGFTRNSSTRRASAFEGKRICLTDAMLEAFLDLMDRQPFELRVERYLEKEVHHVSAVWGNPSVEVRVIEEEGQMLLNLTESNKSMKVLDRKGKFVYSKGQLYRVDLSFAKAMTPLLAQVSELSEVRVRIEQEQMDHFFSRILPRMEQEATVILSPELEKRVVREPMEVDVYLDQLQNEILADVVFRYGSYEIQPLNPDGPINRDAESQAQLIRDFTAENDCLAWFKQQGFHRVEASLRLEDVEAIGDFFYKGIEELLAMATVYRTERFMTVSLKVPNPFKIQCKMEQQSGLLEMKVESEGMSKEELIALLQAYRLKKRYHRLKNGDLVALQADGSIADLDELAQHLNLKSSQLVQDVVTLPAYRAVYLEAIGKDREGILLERNQQFKRLIRNLEEPDEQEILVPESLKSVLRDYQLVGFKWLKTLTQYGFGGILADDMGLGKTLQVLTFLLSEKESRMAAAQESGKALIVVPTSLIFNWQAEIEKFAPSLNLRIVTGLKHERSERLSDLTDVDVVITTYGLLKRDLDYYRAINFEYCIIDEAQHIKNANTLSAKSVKCIKARNTIALTGTPIENGLTELWSIFDFIMPGYLYQNAQFINRYAMPIIKDGDEKVKAHLRRHIQPFVLRRLKQDVLRELPEKIESVMVNQMTTDQAKLYAAWQLRAKKEFEEEVAQNNGQANKIKILALLTRLRQLACHPALFIDQYKGSSGKLEQLLELVDDAISGGHRLLIFSQFTTLLGLVRTSLETQGVECWYLDGSVSSQDRMDRVKAFNEGEGHVFLISLKAGGTGLNLTGADMVVHLDPWWNPAVEDQATDRAYRIGQTKAVQVFKMITKGTIEEKIDELKQRKKALIDEMITPGETWLNQMSVQDLAALLKD